MHAANGPLRREGRTTINPHAPGTPIWRLRKPTNPLAMAMKHSKTYDLISLFVSHHHLPSSPVTSPTLMSVRVNLRRRSGESGAIIIDDQSDRIGYLGDWYDITTGNQAINNGTLKELDEGGGGFFFEFTGKQIQVYGTVRSQPKNKPYVATSSTYSIDDEQMGSFTSPNLTQEADGLMLFNSGTIPLKSHVLTVSVDSASEDFPYLLDYLVFIPAPPLSSDALPVSSGGSPFGPSSSSSLVNTALSFSTTPTSSSSSSAGLAPTGSPHSDVVKSRPSHVGPIVGGVIGGVLFLVLWFSALVWCAKRRNAKSRENSMSEGKPMPPSNVPGGIPGVTPYLLPRDYNGSSANFVPPETSGPLAPRSVLGNVETAHASTGKIRSPDLVAPYSSTMFHGEGSGSRQQLLAGSSGTGARSDVSSGSGSGGAVSAAAFAHEEGEAGRRSSEYEPHAARRARSPKSGHSSQGSRNEQSPARRPPAVHADSGLRFPRDTDPDEVLSQATTQPPAYTPFSAS